MINIKYILGFVFIVTLASSLILVKRLKATEAERDRFISNYEASLAEKDSITTNNRLLSFTIKELKTFNDSITNELLSTSKKLKIKDRELKSLYYIKSQSLRIDTIITKDTIFVKDFSIDTTLLDRWYNLNLSLKYPSTIIVSPSFNSEKHIIVHSKKVLRKPSKWFFIRWFQKRDVVIEVEIQEQNPYIHEVQNKFIEILK